MKIRSREINIVSMSALDMFCSALGAFMFLAILSFPFVPNLGPEAKEAAKIKQDLAETKKQLQESQQKQKEAEEALKKEIESEATDVMIVIDQTASMAAILDSQKKEIADFARVVGAFRGKARVGIIAYRDKDCPDTLEKLPLTPVDSANLPRVEAFANGLQASSPPCNKEPEEAVEAALQLAINSDWSGSAPKYRYIVVIGDNAAYSDRLALAYEAARRWGEAGSHLSTLRIDDRPGAAAFYDQLAANGKGRALVQLKGEGFAMPLLKLMTE